MKGNLIDGAELGNVVARVRSLQLEKQPLWGSMSVAAMLNHCSKVNRAVLVERTTSFNPTVKQRVSKFFALHLLPRLPKNVNSPVKAVLPDVDVQLVFEEEQAKCIESLLAIAGNPKPLNQAHPFFGPLNTKEWGRFLWLHTDHHLRQFGV